MLLLGCSWAQKLIISVYNAIVWNILNLLQCDLLNKNRWPTIYLDRRHSKWPGEYKRFEREWRIADMYANFGCEYGSPLSAVHILRCFRFSDRKTV